MSQRLGNPACYKRKAPAEKCLMITYKLKKEKKFKLLKVNIYAACLTLFSALNPQHADKWSLSLKVTESTPLICHYTNCMFKQDSKMSTYSSEQILKRGDKARTNMHSRREHRDMG